MNRPTGGLRVAVLGGGRTSEHDVSLASARSVADALESLGHEVLRLTIDREGRWAGDRARPGRGSGLAAAVALLSGCDVVVPVLHGPHGEDGTLAALLDLVGVPYVGSGLSAGAVAMDKGLTKLVARSVGVATTPGRIVGRAAAARYRWTRPVVVKPVAAGSSHGVALVSEPAALEAALTSAFALDDRVLIEDVVVGREIDVAVLGRPDGTRTVAPALEIVCAGLFDTATKYDGSADFRIPAALAAADRVRLEAAAVAVYDALGCRGVARVDFFWTEAGPVLNEVNTMPGFTAHSQVPKMFAAAGLGYSELVDLLVRDVAGSSAAVVPVPAYA